MGGNSRNFVAQKTAELRLSTLTQPMPKNMRVSVIAGSLDSRGKKGKGIDQSRNGK